METFSICGGVVCFGFMFALWWVLSRLGKFSPTVTGIGFAVICLPFLLAGISLGKFMFLDEPLIGAAYEGDEAEIERLLNAGANPNVMDDLHYPVCAALANNHPGTVRLLIERGADPNVVCDDISGPTAYPLDIAANRRDWELVRYLKSKGAVRMSQDPKRHNP